MPRPKQSRTARLQRKNQAETATRSAEQPTGYQDGQEEEAQQRAPPLRKQPQRRRPASPSELDASYGTPDPKRRRLQQAQPQQDHATKEVASTSATAATAADGTATTTTRRASTRARHDNAENDSKAIDTSTRARRHNHANQNANSATIPRNSLLIGGTTATRQAELERAMRRRDSALQRLGELATSSAASRAGSSSSVASGTARRDGSVLGRGTRRGGAAAEAAAGFGDTTGLELGDEEFDDIDNSFDIGDDVDEDMEDADEDPRGRSLAKNTSSTASVQSRGRRGSSITRRDDAPIRPSSRGLATPNLGSVFQIGAFRRRAREPSILGTSRRPLPEDSEQQRQQRQQERADSDTDMEDPDALGGVEDSASGKRRANVDESDSEATTASRRSTRTETRGGKRISVGAHSGSRPEEPIRTSSPNVEDVPDKDDAAPSPSSSSSLSSNFSMPDSPLPPPQSDQNSNNRNISNRRATATPRRLHNDSEDDAPPASSDPEDTVSWSDLRALAKRRRRFSPVTPLRNSARYRGNGAAAESDDSDQSSPPALTHSPNSHPAARRGAPSKRTKKTPTAKSPPKLDTAYLKSLLPRRRQRQNARDGPDVDRNGESGDPEVFDVSEPGPGEDELSFVDPRGGRAPTSRAKKTHAASKKTAAGAVAAATPPVRRVYVSSRPQGSKEGQEASKSEAVGDEVKNAIVKFQHVDKWALEFEDSVGSSSPVDAR